MESLYSPNMNDSLVSKRQCLSYSQFHSLWNSSVSVISSFLSHTCSTFGTCINITAIDPNDWSTNEGRLPFISLNLNLNVSIVYKPHTYVSWLSIVSVFFNYTCSISILHHNIATSLKGISFLFSRNVRHARKGEF